MAISDQDKVYKQTPSGDAITSSSLSASGSSTPISIIPDKPVSTGKKRGRPSKAAIKEREEAKRARGEITETKPKDKVPKKRGRKPKIDWDSMSEEVNKTTCRLLDSKLITKGRTKANY